MSFYDDLLAVFDKYNVGLPPHLAQQLYNLNVPPAPAPNPTPSGPSLPSGCEYVHVDGAPDCLVRLSAVEGHWGTLPMSILEIGSQFAEGTAERTFIEKNTEHANGTYDIGELIPAVCSMNGAELDTSKPILNTVANPSINRLGPFLATVAACIDHYSKLAQPTTGDFAHP